MDYTTFQYITSIPDTITNQDWFNLAVLSYNLGLTCFWFLITTYLFDKLFVCFGKFYKKGAD